MGTQAVFLVDKISDDFRMVYPESTKKAISACFGLPGLPIICSDDIDSYVEECREAEAIFSTWNMPVLSSDEIRKRFPSLKHVFYAAGTVKYFAGPYLDLGIRVHSAASVNAQPVAQYATAQILLAAKGFYRSRITPLRHFFRMKKAADSFPGNYRAKIGILGFGNIGQRVANALRSQADVSILAYDPYVSPKAYEGLGVSKATLREVFSSCDVISNHMPDIPETKGVISAELFAEMKPTATFINTGRGAQVDEAALASTLKRNPLQTALLDVTFPEPIRPWNALLRCGNAYVTPHIAGSLGEEKARMGEAMLEELRLVVGGSAPLYEVDSASFERSA